MKYQLFRTQYGRELSSLFQKFLSVPGKNVRINCTDLPCASEASKENGGKFPKRKKSVLLLAFCGQGYMGMQRNPGIPTIEKDLLEALRKAGAFPLEMEHDLGKLHYQRCSRTDKGVSASRLAVSLKLFLFVFPTTHMVYDRSLIPLINTHLPASIKVFALTKVTRSFDSRRYCGERTYEYLLPTYAFAPLPSTTLDYRIDDATIALVNKLLQYYVGTHNFHNFTSGKKFEDPSSKRHIVSFQIGERMFGKASCKTCGNVKELEFLPLRVKGHSFMIHQIRKMVGLVIAIVRGHTPEETISRTFLEEKVDLPRAPALGLLLENVHFDGYNRNFASDGSREPLEWSRFEDEIEQFKKEHIYQTIVDTEANDLSMMHWLSYSLKIHIFSRAERLLQEVSDVPDSYLNSSPGVEMTNMTIGQE